MQSKTPQQSQAPPPQPQMQKEPNVFVGYPTDDDNSVQIKIKQDYIELFVIGILLLGSFLFGQVFEKHLKRIFRKK